MPKFFEVFGIKASALQEVGLLELKTAICPFIDARCDGGGNRHQTKITMQPEHELRSLFNNSIEAIIPAVCSIDYGKDKWVVCPRRLMGFRNDHPAIPPENLSLQPHERQVFLQAGLLPNVEYGVWSEVYLQYVVDDTEIDYHFDFIIAPLSRNISVDVLAKQYGFSETQDKADIVKSAKTGKNIEKAANGSIRLQSSFVFCSDSPCSLKPFRSFSF